MIQEATNRTAVSPITWPALFLFYFKNTDTELSQLGKTADILRSTCYSFITKDKMKYAGNNSTNKN
jgi:hypothetical protein